VDNTFGGGYRVISDIDNVIGVDENYS